MKQRAGGAVSRKCGGRQAVGCQQALRHRGVVGAGVRERPRERQAAWKKEKERPIKQVEPKQIKPSTTIFGIDSAPPNMSSAGERNHSACRELAWGWGWGVTRHRRLAVLDDPPRVFVRLVLRQTTRVLGVLPFLLLFFYPTCTVYQSINVAAASASKSHRGRAAGVAVRCSR